MEHVRGRFTGADLCAAGYSLGASYLAKYVGEQNDRCTLVSAALFACPTNLPDAIGRLGEKVGAALIDQYVLVPSVQRVLRECLPHLEGAPHLDLVGAARATSMAAFDGCVIAPMMGCASAADYYRQASSGPLLPRARVPMLFLSAHNDPIAPASLIDVAPFECARDAPLLLATTAEGGHSMGWPEGGAGASRSGSGAAGGAWSAQVLVEWVHATVDASRSQAEESRR